MNYQIFKMADDGISSSYDVIVYGTGLPESIIAAAVAKAGLSVFHFDKNAFYGGSWASFNLEQIIELVSNFEQATPNLSDSELGNIANLSANEKLIIPDTNGNEFSDFKFEWFVGEETSPAAETAQNSEESAQVHPERSSFTRRSIMEQARRFSIDLTPKILFSTGSAIDILINSKVSRYAEFKLVDRILTFINDELKVVPCSRSDVFQTDQLDLVEKRLLMKFLEQRRSWDAENGSQTLSSFLETQNLSPKLKHYVFYALANGDKDISVKEALKFINKFLNSVGRYGNSPFLWTLYGSGELPQCFCRMCAVFGGVYCLRMPLQALIVDEEQKKISAIVADNRRINCSQKFVTSQRISPDFSANDESSLISKTVLITDRSILDDGKGHISYVNMKLNEGSPTVKILEVSNSGMACPKDFCVVYLSISDNTDPKKHINDVIAKLFNDENKPKVLFRLDFKQKVSNSQPDVSSFKNFIKLPLPDNQLDYDDLVDKVSNIFVQNFENLAFFPETADENEEHQFENNDEANPGDHADSENPENRENVDIGLESKKIDSHNVL